MRKAFIIDFNTPAITQFSSEPLENLVATRAAQLVEVGAFSSSFRGLVLVPSKWRYLVSPTNG
jgi:hypothetical protein